jgi:hypothetical protein
MSVSWSCPAPPLVTFSLGGLGSGASASTNVVTLSALWTSSVSNFAPSDVIVSNPNSLVYTVQVSGSGSSYSVIVTFLAPLAPGNLTVSVGAASGTIVPATGPPLYPFRLEYRMCFLFQTLPCMCILAARVLVANEHHPAVLPRDLVSQNHLPCCWPVTVAPRAQPQHLEL